MKTAVIFLFSVLLIISCRKEKFITSPEARVTITADTLKYDTVFTSVGSVTQSFKIINENNQKLRLNSITLKGGATSAFKMNVDGLPTTEASNIEIEANDSVYVFVQVKVDPAAGNLPFIIRDSIQVSFNGNDRLVQLEAWGQNAHFVRGGTILNDTSWTSELPHVILDYLYVAEDTRLTLQPGCRIYVHANAPVIIEGTLVGSGGKDTADHIYFQGDRLDAPYKDYPASWPGIYFSATSRDNQLTYTVIKNAYQAIALDGPASNGLSKVELNQCVIDNAFDAGIFAANSSVTATNVLISNCGKNIAITNGGTYSFTHCTVASYSNNYISHKDPVLIVSDAAGTQPTTSLNAQFVNCIFWGEGGLVENEVVVSKTGSAPFTVNFDHVLWKMQSPPQNSTITAAIQDQNPDFDSIDVSNQYYNFRLKQGSAAIDAGKNAGVLIDLVGNARPVGPAPDLGAFEQQ